MATYYMRKGGGGQSLRNINRKSASFYLKHVWPFFLDFPIFSDFLSGDEAIRVNKKGVLSGTANATKYEKRGGTKHLSCVQLCACWRVEVIKREYSSWGSIAVIQTLRIGPSVGSIHTVLRLCWLYRFQFIFNLVRDMEHVMWERHPSINYQHLFINWKAKEIERSIFIRACKDTENVLCDTGMPNHAMQMRLCEP